MLKNNFKLALRRLLREKLFTVLNVTGLTVGIASFILLFVYVRHELSYDKFHSKVDDIYVISWEVDQPGGLAHWENFSIKGARLIRDQVPEVKLMTQLNLADEGKLVQIGDADFYNKGVLMADENFLKIFDFKVLKGTVQAGEPNKAAITEKLANKYFGKNDPIGKTIKIDGEGEFVITAVMKDVPVNSHIQFEIVISGEANIQKRMARNPEEYQWSYTAYNYTLLTENAEHDEVEKKAETVVVNAYPERMLSTNEAGEKHFGSKLTSYGDIHLKSGFQHAMTPVGDMLYVFVFSSIGVLILFIACFNYINLVTARSMKKAREIGLRKVVGARRSEIIWQQMIEAGLFTFLSVSLAFGLAERSLPFFNNLIGTTIELHYLSLDFLVLVVGLSTVVAFLAGYYPAIKLSKFSPIDGLRGTNTPKGKSGMRRSLVFFQFFIAQALIICTFIIQSQLSYLQNKSLGYDKDQTLFIDTYGELKGRGNLFKSEIQSIPGIESVSMTESKFEWAAVIFMKFKDIEGFEGVDPEATFFPTVFTVDRSFLKTMGMTMVSGKAFDELEEGITEGVIINEETAKQLGWHENPVGKELTIWNEKKQVVGVVKDFHDETLKEQIQPAILSLGNDSPDFAHIRISGNDVQSTLAAIEAKWNALVAERPLTYQFYDDHYDALYRKESRLGGLFNVFSIIAISISILGLIGLTTFSAQQRLKEFGIRKVLGAKVLQLVVLLSKEFVWLLLVAFVVAAPLTYYYMNDWLTEFTYRIEIGVIIYLLAMASTLLICVFTVGIQSIKVSRFNPAEVLRSE